MTTQQKAAICAAVTRAVYAVGIQRLRTSEFFGMRQAKADAERKEAA